MKYEVAIMNRSLQCFAFIIGFSVHPKDRENDFLEINFYFFFSITYKNILRCQYQRENKTRNKVIL